MRSFWPHVGWWTALGGRGRVQSSVVSARDRRMSGCVRIRRSCKSPMANSRAARAPRQNSPPAADELKALDLKSSKVIDLEMFVPRGEVDPVYLQQIRVIGAAMADAGIVGSG